jgi:hypothetical protein
MRPVHLCKTHAAHAWEHTKTTMSHTTMNKHIRVSTKAQAVSSLEPHTNKWTALPALSVLRHNIHLTNKHKHKTLCFSQPARHWRLHKQAVATSDPAALSIPAVAAAGGAAVIIRSYMQNNSTSTLVETAQVQATGHLVQ